MGQRVPETSREGIDARTINGERCVPEYGISPFPRDSSRADLRARIRSWGGVGGIRENAREKERDTSARHPARVSHFGGNVLNVSEKPAVTRGLIVKRRSTGAG